MPTCPRHHFDYAEHAYCPGCLAGIALDESEAEEEAGAPAATLGSYELITEIGRGGMGVVYLARQKGLNRSVALKLLPSGSLAGREFIQRFRREGELAASLQHPDIVRVFEAGEAEGELFYSMELITGGSLAEWREEKACTPREAATFLSILTGAVQYAHGRGILHRDLKPSNILLDDGGRPKVADFGLARPLEPTADLTLGTHSFGSPAYMAPELIRDPKAASVLSDIYSLGAILYFLLTGRSPFASASLDELLRQVRECEPAAPRVLDPSIPRDLQKICLKALDKNPARRYATAASFGEDLERFLEGRPVLANPSGPLTKMVRFARRSPLLAGAAAAFVIALVAGVSGIAWQATIANRRADENARQAAELRYNLYASDISAASVALQRGDAPLADAILSRWDAAPAENDPRGFEWTLLKQEAAPATYRLLGHREATITSVALSADGGKLAIADQSGKVSIRPAHGERPFEFPAWSADEIAAIPTTLGGGWVAGSRDSTIRWYDAAGKVAATAQGRQFSLAAAVPRAAIVTAPRFHWWNKGGDARVLDWKTGATVLDLPGDWRQAVISADGGKVALAGATGGLRIITIATGFMEELPAPNPVWALSFSPDGTLLAAGTRRAAVIWKVGNRNVAPVIIPHNLTVWMTAFSPDGRKFLAASSDRRVRVWRTDQLTSPPLTLAGHHSEVWCAAFSPDGDSVYAGGKDGDVLTWRIDQPAPAREILPHDHPMAPFFSKDGRYLVTKVQRRSQLLDLTTGGATAFPDGVEALGFAKDRRSVIIADSTGRTGTAPIEELGKVRLHPVTPPAGEIRYLRTSGAGSWIVRIYSEGLVLLEDPATGAVMHRFRGPRRGARHAVAGSPDGTWFAICGDGAEDVVLHNLRTGQVILLSPGSPYYYVTLAFSHDGRLLAGGDLSGPVRVWNVADGTLIATLPGHAEETSCVTFSPDGRTLATMGYHQDLKLWQVATWRELHSINLPDAAFSLAFAPDGRKLVATLGNTKNEWMEWFPATDAAER